MRRVCNPDRSVRGFWWCVRRVNDRSPVHAPPFSAAGRAMCLDRGGVDRQGHAPLAAIGQRLEDRLPMSALGPAIEAIVDGRVRTIFGRAIPPARAALEHVDDTADAARHISLRSGLMGRQMRLNAPPLPIAEPEQPFAHRNLLLPNRSAPENQS